MPWIENVSKVNARDGIHYDTQDRGILISISDPCSEKVSPKHKFLEVHYFEFSDTENSEDEFSISDEDAQMIANLLRCAHANGINVVVNCHAGLCRSGAVAEVGVIIGFQDAEAVRQPNLLVKKKLMKALGIDYDYDKDAADREEKFNIPEWE